MSSPVLLLDKLGADKIMHLSGDLKSHLMGTYEKLKMWGSNERACNAGLFHAVYGTQKFERPMVSPTNRPYIASFIGSDAEELVYLYCACDRELVYPQIGVEREVIFYNRFTREKKTISQTDLQDLCEITLANELDIVNRNPDMINDHRDWFIELLVRFRNLVSKAGYLEFERTFRSAA